MKKIKTYLLLAGLVAFLSSCSVTRPYWVTSNPIGSKVGKSSAKCYFYSMCFDEDYSVRMAAKNGGITKIATVDIRVKNTVGIIWEFETIVTGE